MQYYYANEQNKKAGPFSVDELKSHGIQPHTLVWCQGMDDWKPAGQVAELKSLFPDMPNTPPPVPPGADDPFAAGNAGYGPGGGYGYQQQGFQGGYGGYPGGGPYNFSAIYEQHFDVNAIPPNDQAQFRQHNIQNDFSVGLGIFLHFITFGIFTMIKVGLVFDQLPKIKEDDHNAGKAIGFLFIPLFNLYWVFVFWGQIVKRINFQYKLRGQHPPISYGLSLAHPICRLIPYVNFLCYLVLVPILYGQIQSAVNGLARENQQVYAGQKAW